MGARHTSRGMALARVLELGALSIALIASFCGGVWYQSSQPGPRAASDAGVLTYDAANGFPRPDAPRPVDPRQPEAQAVDARARLVRRDTDAIAAESRQAANADWDRWERNTDRYRTALKAKLDALEASDAASEDDALLKYKPLEGKDGFPLFEIGARERLKYLYDPESLDRFRRERPVLAAHRWLRDRGIDLIFVAIPKMTEVYIEHFLDPCPTDGIIAPHMRHSLLELLENDVEVVDGFRLLRSYRDTDAEYLYNTADTHWAPRAMRITAKHLADRIERYRFGAQARYALPIVKSMLHPFALATYRPELKKLLPLQDGWPALSPEQQQRAAAVQTTTDLFASPLDGRPLTSDPKSPVIVIGHSYVQYFCDHLVRQLNLRVQTQMGLNNTTEAFGDFLREPELLAHCRVVVWITTGQHMTHFQPMPSSISVNAEPGRDR